MSNYFNHAIVPNKKYRIFLQSSYVFLVLFCLSFIILQLLILYSVAGGDFMVWAYPQFQKFSVLFIVMIVVSFVDLKYLHKVSYICYIGSLALLLYVLWSGHNAMGATRWIRVFGLTVQPSELMKLSLIICLARFYNFSNLAKSDQWFTIIKAGFLILLPVLLVMRQPDLGTAVVICFIGISMLFVVGVSWRKFLLLFSMLLLLLPLLWYNMHDYQKRRVMTFINPTSDPLGAGYNVIQSKIAIGSGGLFGKGMLKGTQSQLRFLPERHTDFIFTSISEELGFIVAAIVLGMYLFLVSFAIFLAFRVKDYYYRLIAFGIAMYFFVHTIVNIAMITGLMPVVGIPLPFLSYGGTILSVSMVLFGLLLNIFNFSNKIKS